MSAPSRQKKWRDRYVVQSDDVDPHGNLSLVAQLCLLQETAWRHAESLGFGYSDISKSRLLWVVTRFLLEMSKTPKWGESLEIETWARWPDGIYAYRDFVIYNEGQEEIGRASSSWLILDETTRRPQKIEMLGPVTDVSLRESNGLEASKIELDQSFTPLHEYQVRWSDLDMNRHVNNTKYAQWIMDSLPAEWHAHHRVRRYLVNFLAEMHLGDTVKIAEKTDDQRDKTRVFKGQRPKDSKTVFAVELGFE